jgi:hypothetical protein
MTLAVSNQGVFWQLQLGTALWEQQASTGWVAVCQGWGGWQGRDFNLQQPSAAERCVCLRVFRCWGAARRPLCVASSCLVSCVACLRVRWCGRFTGQARSFVLLACLGGGMTQNVLCLALESCLGGHTVSQAMSCDCGHWEARFCVKHWDQPCCDACLVFCLSRHRVTD